MIDTHAHLDFEDYRQDREEVIRRFFKKGGKALINIGVDQARIETTLQLTQKYPQVFAAIGFHPHEAETITRVDVKSQLAQYLERPKVVAIGEIGMDYYRLKKSEERIKQKQKELFQTQLDLAREKKLPVIIHCRESYKELNEIISQPAYTDLKLVIHCYGGSLKQTEKFLARPNIWFSFAGNITFPKDKEAEIFKVIQTIPLERIMVETDCPFLAPVPYRGQRNEPLYVRDVIKKIFQVKQSEKNRQIRNLMELENILDANAEKFFGLNLK